jgi:hypothetical protein
MNEAQPPETGDALAPDDEPAHRQAAAQLRRERPRWVVFWLGRTGQYRAWPLFRAPRGTSLTADTAEQMAAQMDEAEQAARRSRARSPKMDAAG